MGDSQLRSRYDRLRDEREARGEGNRTDERPEYESWDGEIVDAVFETIDEDGVIEEVPLVQQPQREFPLFTEHENWSSGRLASVDIVYGDDIKRLAYEIWLLKANQNNARTARILAEELEGELPRYPKSQTIRDWRRNEEWDSRASEDIARIAQKLNRRHFEKLFAYTDEAIETKIQIMRNEHPENDSKRLDTISRSIDSFLALRGLGTAGVQGGNEPPKAAARLVEEAGTTQEKSRALRDEILEEKQLMAGKKKHR